VTGVILVTGGAGFIGSHIVDALVAGGHRVRVLDRLHPAAHAARPSYLNPAAEFVEADVADEAAVARCLRDVDAVCHQAAMVGLGKDIADIGSYVRDNDVGTAALLKALARAPGGSRLVLASSMVVYGEGGYVCKRDGPVAPGPRLVADLRTGRFEPPCPTCGAPLCAVAISESAPLAPRNVYAATKTHQEHLAFAFARETGIAVTALRYHNVYGPRMPRDTPYAGVASIFISAIAAGEPPRVFEDGQQLRDFVHVRDVAAANVRALTVADPIPGAFNVASGRPRTVLEMAAALAAAAGPAAPAPITTGEFRLGDVRHVFASPDRAERELGFRATEDFADGMRELAEAPLRAA